MIRRVPARFTRDHASPTHRRHRSHLASLPRRAYVALAAAALTLAATVVVAALAGSAPAPAAARPLPGHHPLGTPGLPRFMNYVSPQVTGDSAGEPSIASNWTSEQTFSNSNGRFRTVAA